MPHVYHDRPQFVVAERAFGAGHAGWPDAVIENPLQLAIGVTLNFLGGQRRDGWRDVVDERDTGVLAVVAMAGDAIVAERFLAVGQRLRIVRKGVLLLFVADRNVMLDGHYHLPLQLCGRFGLA